jgi:hypothetical protein
MTIALLIMSQFSQREIEQPPTVCQLLDDNGSVHPGANGAAESWPNPKPFVIFWELRKEATIVARSSAVL